MRMSFYQGLLLSAFALSMGTSMWAANLSVVELTKRYSPCLLEVTTTLENGKKVISTGINLTPAGLFVTTGDFISAKKAAIKSTVSDKSSSAIPVHFEFNGVIALGKVTRGEAIASSCIPMAPTMPKPGSPVNVISFKDKKTGRSIVSRNAISRQCYPFAEAGGKANAIFKHIPMFKLAGKVHEHCYGGLVTDERGVTIGMVSAILGNKKNCYFVVPFAVLRSFMMAMNLPQVKKVHNKLLPFLDWVFEADKKKMTIPANLQKALEGTAAIFAKRSLDMQKGYRQWQIQRDLRMEIIPENVDERKERDKAIQELVKKYPQWPLEVAECIYDKQIVPGMNDKQACLVGRFMQAAENFFAVIQSWWKLHHLHPNERRSGRYSSPQEFARSHLLGNGQTEQIEKTWSVVLMRSVIVASEKTN